MIENCPGPHEFTGIPNSPALVGVPGPDARKFFRLDKKVVVGAIAGAAAIAAAAAEALWHFI